MASAVFGPMPTTERGVASKLDANTAGTKLCYGNGNSVIIRDVKNPGICELYDEHRNPVTVARFSPNGAYIASADTSGKVRMWAYTHPEKMLKKETPVFAGQINDLAWDDEGKRLVCGGDGGKAAHVKAFTAETGSSLGEFAYNTKQVLTVCYRPTKPFRALTGGQDFQVGVFNGPPFKFSHGFDHHTNFVQCIRYNADGSLVASVGSDKKIFVYSGEDVQVKSELAGHEGSVFGCAWNPKNNSQLMTCSGDKTVKLWDAESGKCISSIDMTSTGLKGPEAMQVACVFAGELPISLGLSGDLSYMDFSSGKVTTVVQAHTSLGQALSVDYTADNTVYLSTLNGSCFSYTSSGAGKRIDGESHEMACDISVMKGVGYSIGYDNNVRAFDAAKNQYTGDVVGLAKQPIVIARTASDPNTLVTCSTSTITLIRNNKIVCELEGLKFEPTCVALSPDGSELAVGHNGKGVKLYKVIGDKLELDPSAEVKGLFGNPTCMQYSPDGQFLAVGDKHKEISLYTAKTMDVVVKDLWVYHQASVTDLCFSPDGKYLATGSVDAHIYVWNVAKPKSKTKIALAHMGGVVSVGFGVDGVVFSVGRDNCIKKWLPKMPE